VLLLAQIFFKPIESVLSRLNHIFGSFVIIRGALIRLLARVLTLWGWVLTLLEITGASSILEYQMLLLLCMNNVLDRLVSTETK